MPPRTAASGCAGYPAATWSSWPSRPGASVTGWVRRLEGVLLAGLTPHNFDEALRSLLGIAQELLPGDRADILLLDDSGDASCRGQARAPAPRHVTAARWRSATACSAASPRRRVAATGTRALIDDLQESGAPEAVSGQGRGASARPATPEPPRGRRRGVERPVSLPPQAASVGDFYDALALGDGRLGVAIGDVTGKGLRAAAAMSRLRSGLHAYALDSASPADVLSRLGRLAKADGAMATALYLTLDPATGALQLASAGHPPPLCIEDGRARFIELRPALSPPLGLDVTERRQVGLELPVGSTLVLYTDGLVERTRNTRPGHAPARRCGGPPGERVAGGALRPVARRARARGAVPG